MEDYLALWGGEIPTGPIQVLSTQVTVVGEQISASKSEFAKVRLTVRPSDTFDVFDAVNERDELEKLDVAWPDPVVFGLLDALTNAKQGPLISLSIILEDIWYHEVDTSKDALRSAGRDAGYKIIEAIRFSD
jgi:hypothetical protein